MKTTETKTLEYYGAHRSGLTVAKEMEPNLAELKQNGLKEIYFVDPQKGLASRIAERFNQQGLPSHAIESYYETTARHLEGTNIVSLTDDISVLKKSLTVCNNKVRSGQMNMVIPMDRITLETGIQATILPGDEASYNQVFTLLSFLESISPTSRQSSREFQNQVSLSEYYLDGIRTQLSRQTAHHFVKASGNDVESLGSSPLSMVYCGILMPLAVIEQNLTSYSEMDDTAKEMMPVKYTNQADQKKCLVMVISQKNKTMSLFSLHSTTSGKREVTGFFKYDPQFEESFKQLSTRPLLNPITFAD